MTDQIAFIASTAYFFDGDRGEAVTGKSRDGRRIAIYLDESTGSHWVCRLESWERYAYGDLDYSLWCSTSEAYELTQDCEGTFFGDFAPDMSPRDRWGRILESAMDRIDTRLAGLLYKKGGLSWSKSERLAMMDLRSAISDRLAQVRS
jgi:hypothetical protein